MYDILKENSLNHESLLIGISFLSKIDPDLEKVIIELGNPPLWSREPGFPTLIHIILEQQVSLASARAAFDKLNQAAGDELNPKRFLEFSEIELNEIGFSRQKTKYCQELSEAIIHGDLELDTLHGLDDKNAQKELMKIKGIGPWTASIYLLRALLRPDVWPSGDLALENAVQKIKDLSEKPNTERLNMIAAQWKPWRAVAARIIWHYYLNQSFQET